MQNNGSERANARTNAGERANACANKRKRTLVHQHANARARNETKRYDTIQHGTIRYTPIRCDTARCDAIRHDTIRFETIRCEPMRYDMIRHNTIEDGHFFPEIEEVGSSLDSIPGLQSLLRHFAVSPPRSRPRPHGSLELVEEIRFVLSDRRSESAGKSRNSHSTPRTNSTEGPRNSGTLQPRLPHSFSRFPTQVQEDIW